MHTTRVSHDSASIVVMGSIDSGQASKKNTHTLGFRSLCKALVMVFFYQRWSTRYTGPYSGQSWKVRHFPLNFQATVRNKPGAKFSRAKNSPCNPPPPPCMSVCYAIRLGSCRLLPVCARFQEAACRMLVYISGCVLTTGCSIAVDCGQHLEHWLELPGRGHPVSVTDHD